MTNVTFRVRAVDEFRIWDKPSTYGKRGKSTYEFPDEVVLDALYLEARNIFDNRLATGEPMTLQQIGDVYGITRERARQIEAKLVREFKEWIQREVPDFKYLEIGPRED